MSLSIILTCYNEIPIIFESFEVLSAMMERTGIETEFIIVDDGSQPQVRKNLAAFFEGRNHVRLILSEHNEGRGAAVSKGIRAAGHPYVCFIDTDLEIPAHSIIALYFEALASGPDMVIAERIYRWQPGLRDSIRNISSRLYRRFSSAVLSLNNLDTETGCKLFRRDSILKILDGVVDKRWFWDTEVVAEALKDGQKIAEIPLVVIRRSDKTSSVHVIRDTLRYLKAIWAYRKQSDRCRKSPYLSPSPHTKKTAVLEHSP